jgi:predicted nucleic acid-binding protein
MSATSRVSADIVIDANLAVLAVLPVPAEVNVLERFLDWRQQGRRIVAPMLWLAEAVSAIRMSVYVQMISLEEGLIAIDDLFALDVETIPLDAQLCRSAFEWAGRLGQGRAYDGFYLALSEQMRAKLWTADRRLVNGAQQAGASWVCWIGESEAVSNL